MLSVDMYRVYVFACLLCVDMCVCVFAFLLPVDMYTVYVFACV